MSWSAKLLTEKGLKEAKVCADHAGTDDMIKAGVRAAGRPDDLYAIIKLMKATGKVNFQPSKRHG